MKSAFELAMERLKKSEPDRPLSARQKAEIADIESLFKSRIAEREIAFQQELQQAEEKGDAEKISDLRQTFLHEKSKLEAERDSRKDRVRSGK